MARKSQNVSYTTDAFDDPPEGPVGVHRGNPAWYAIILPYIIVLAIAVTSGLLVWAFTSGEIYHLQLPWNNNNNQNAQSMNNSKKSEKEKSNEEEDSEDNDDFEDSNTEKDQNSNKDKANKTDNKNSKDSENDSNSQAEVDKSVSIKVINATKISGHAASKADKLKQAGYSNVTAGNPTGKVPSDSVVWYKDDSQKAAAEDIAKKLGITAIENEKEIVSQIVVVLCK